MYGQLRRHRSSLYTVLMFATLVFFSGCILVVKEDDDDDDYYHRRWSLDVIVYSTYSESPDNGADYSLSLDEFNQLSGNAGCIDFEGTYSVSSNNAMRVDPLTASRGSSCRTEALTSQYLDGLENARTLEASEEDLVIYFGSERNAMRFVPAR